MPDRLEEHLLEGLLSWLFAVAYVEKGCEGAKEQIEFLQHYIIEDKKRRAG